MVTALESSAEIATGFWGVAGALFSLTWDGITGDR
jgi:hypothetical protein